MAVPTTVWSETGDNRIRELKTQVREVVAVDHEFTSTQTASTGGQHLQVTLQEQADLGTGAVDATILGNQTVSGVGELVYTTEADADIQITSVAGINAAAMTGVYAAANVASIATIGALLYPVGSIYANASDATNPGTLLGFGTWVAIEEEVIAGFKSGGTFDPVGTLSEGEETHVLIEAELAAHTHVVAGGAGTGQTTANTKEAADTSRPTTSASAGSDTAHNNIQPTYVAYLWRRTV